MYESGRRSQVLARGMTLAEAQEWCKDPETSSSTAQSRTAKKRTARYGRWFDGFTRE
jgi:hypothetical protein